MLETVSEGAPLVDGVPLRDPEDDPDCDPVELPEEDELGAAVTDGLPLSAGVCDSDELAEDDTLPLPEELATLVGEPNAL